MVVDPSVAFCRARVRSAGLVVDVVVHSCGLKLTCYFEEHRGICGNKISRLYHGAFSGLLHSLLFFNGIE